MRKRIGLQINSIDSGLHADIFNSIAKKCMKDNLNLIVFPGGTGEERSFQYQESAVYAHIDKKNIDSLIVTSEAFLRTHLEDHLLEEVSKEVEEEEETSSEERILNDEEISAIVGKHNGTPDIKEPVPSISLVETDLGEPFVTEDYKDNLKKLIAHMIEVHGCKTFNIVAGNKENYVSKKRLSYCLEALSAHNIKIQRDNLFWGNLDETSGYGAMIYFFQKHLMPVDCIIALNDDMAIGVEQFAKSHNLHIPEDFKLIGVGNITRSKYNSVSISTIDVDLEHVCSSAVDLAVKLANEEKIPHKTLVSTSLRFRQSCGCVPLNDFATNYIDEDNKVHPFNSHTVHDLSVGYFSLERDLFQMRRFFTDINENLTIEAALSQLKASFPSLHIRACAVVLYERRLEVSHKEAFELPSRATLMMTYDEFIFKSGVHADAPSMQGRSFNPKQGFVPEGVFSERHRMLVVKALYYDNAQFGYVVYEPGDLHPALYDTVFSMVANVLNISILFTQKNATEQHQRLMLAKLEKANNELNGQSVADELTGVYNRRGVMDFGQQTIDLAIEMEKDGLVFYADMDGLKGINDTFGHDAGDIAIKTMADILKQTFRTQDVVGRLGGDEFVIVAVGINREFLPNIRTRIQNAENKWYEENQPPFHMGISFGAVEFNKENCNMDELLTAADKLLYAEKVQKHTRSSVKEETLGSSN